MVETDDWFDDYDDTVADGQIEEYDVTATPNDFNVMTLNSFIEAGAVRIPGFQRNYVWDKVRASRLIESLILGIPVPQLFLYEQDRNRFQVIDGQQRLMSVYYFMKRRFPRIDKRGELRSIFDQSGSIPDAVLYDNEYFEDFNLKLSGSLPNQTSRFNGLNYSTLGEYKTQLDLRPLRNIVVKQSAPEGDDTAIYEVFNRLNTGGVNLRPQEIRTSMYHSAFYDMLYKINTRPLWRELLQAKKPDLHMKDIEILLRAFAMLMRNETYAPSMVRFLNQFSKLSKKNTEERNQFLIDIFDGFLSATEDLPRDIFFRGNNRFNIALFEAVFTALLENAFRERRLPNGIAKQSEIFELSQDRAFQYAAIEGTTRTANVNKRLERAKSIITAI